MAAKPFMRGRNARMLVNIDGDQMQIRLKRHSIEENVAEGADDCNGEDRSRPFVETNFFEIGFEPYMEDEALLDKWLDMIEAHDAQTAELPIVCGFVFNKRDGTKASYMAREITRRPLKVDASGRTEALMMPSGFRARYFKKTQ